jgi:hypothetical protein
MVNGLLNQPLRRQHLLFGQWNTIDKGLYRRLAAATPALMGSLWVAQFQPLIKSTCNSAIVLYSFFLNVTR